MTNYTDDELTSIGNLAESLTPISDIALILSLDINLLRADIKDHSTRVSAIYRTGKARGLLAVREATIKKANNGDLAAVAELRHFRSLMEDDENL